MMYIVIIINDCFEPVQVSTGLPYYRRPFTIKVATNLTRRVHFYWSIGDVRETRVCLPALGAEGTLLAGGSPYPARPARNNMDLFLFSGFNRFMHFLSTHANS